VSRGRLDRHLPAANYFSPGVGPGLANVVINDPDAKAGFIFQLINSGNVRANALTGQLAATADQLTSILVSIAGIGAASIGGAAASYAFPSGLTQAAFATLWSWLNIDCDGPVAVDQVSGPRYALDAWTDNPAKKITINRDYPGSSAPSGWRVPAVEPADADLNARFNPQDTVGLSATGNHLYILAPNVAGAGGNPLDAPGAVWAY
jgi:hypothetical protein